MTTNLRAAFLVAMMAFGGQAAAQEGQPPAVSAEAPAALSAPQTETSNPALPSDTAAPQVPALQPAAEAPAASAAPVTAPVSETAQTPAAPEPQPAAADQPVDPANAAPANAAPAAPAEAEGAEAAAAGTAVAAAPAAPGAAGLSAHSMKLDALFYQAPLVVQVVMVGLALATFATLVIFIQKSAEYAFAFGAMRKTAQALSRSNDLHDAASAVAGRKDPAAEMIRAAADELRLAEAEPALIPGVRERSQAALARIEAGMAQKLRAGSGALASIGSLSPFVGLFGTVFGIMNSFIAIAESNTTNLAVVAPGIAEALFATAIGLAAAIPAVLIYNVFARRLAKYRYRINDIAAAALRLQSRALDRLAARS